METVAEQIKTFVDAPDEGFIGTLRQSQTLEVLIDYPDRAA